MSGANDLDLCEAQCHLLAEHYARGVDWSITAAKMRALPDTMRAAIEVWLCEAAAAGDRQAAHYRDVLARDGWAGAKDSELGLLAPAIIVGAPQLGLRAALA